MKVILCLSVLLMLCVMGFGGDVNNNDKPLKGEWDFKMKMNWRISEAGDYVFTVINGLATSEDGTVYILDRKNVKVYILDKNGNFVKAFGRKGEGPGEFTKIRRLFLNENNLIVVDQSNIHYFTTKGEYKRSVPNKYMEFPPVTFIDHDTFISVTEFKHPHKPGKQGKICHYDLKNKKERIISYFDVYNKGSVKIGTPGDYRVFSFSVSSLTPRMVMHYHKNRIYKAMSNEFRIAVTDMKGNELHGFSLNRDKTKVTDEYKEKFVRGFPFPKEAKIQARRNLPDYLNYIEAIFVDDNGYIYAFEPIFKSELSQHVDIFSGEGKYLYSSEIHSDPGYSIGGVMLGTGIMYMLSEDEAGDIFLAKYSIALPN